MGTHANPTLTNCKSDASPHVILRFRILLTVIPSRRSEKAAKIPVKTLFVLPMSARAGALEQTGAGQDQPLRFAIVSLYNAGMSD